MRAGLDRYLDDLERDARREGRKPGGRWGDGLPWWVFVGFGLAAGYAWGLSSAVDAAGGF